MRYNTIVTGFSNKNNNGLIVLTDTWQPTLETARRQLEDFTDESEYFTPVRGLVIDWSGDTKIVLELKQGEITQI